MQLNNSIDVLTQLKEEKIITEEVYEVLLKTLFLHSGEAKLALVNELLDHSETKLAEKKQYFENKQIPTLLKIVADELLIIISKNK